MPESPRQDLKAHPERFRTSRKLPTGETVVLRLLRADDGPALSRYFQSLSPATRAVYAPHPFDRETAHRLSAELDPAESPRWVAVSTTAAGPVFIAYIIVRLTVGAAEVERYAGYGLSLDPATTCALAPSVADTYQGRGVGTALMEPILRWLGDMGLRFMVLSGGVRAENMRARHLYSRLGFRRVGDFRTRGDVANHDRVLELTSGPPPVARDAGPHSP